MNTNIVAKHKRELRSRASITAQDVEKAMSKVNRSKRSAREFLQSVGVVFSKNGGIRIRPI